MSDNQKNVVIGISGGISAYKMCEVAHRLVKDGLNVSIVLTENAEHFVSPLVLSTLIKKRVWLENDFMSSETGWEIPHIKLAREADIVVVAPATATMMSRMASGSGDTLLGAMLLATRAPVIIFPAMNDNMLSHPAVSSAIERCRSYGYSVIDPDSGPLACGYEGKGRLPSPDAICWEIARAMVEKDLLGKRIIVTAGPTLEYIDPVRFISNPSTGKMGFEVACEACIRGAQVTLISGPCHLSPPRGVEFIGVVSALDMLGKLESRFPDSDALVMTAAVGDYRPKKISQMKIKRGENPSLILELDSNPDIVKTISARKKASQLIVGFAAETEALRENAIEKMTRKNLDMIVANDVNKPGAGFAVDTNDVVIFIKDGAMIYTGLQTKKRIAGIILEEMLKLWRADL